MQRTLRISSLIRTAAVAGVLALAAAAVPAASAQAATARPASGSTHASASAAAAAAALAPVTSPRVASASAAKSRAAVLAYWTPQRLKNAKSGDLLAPKQQNTAAAAGATTAGVAQAAPATAVHTVEPVEGKVRAHLAPAPRTGASPDLGTVYVTPAIGKVFFSVGGSDYACSGSSVNSSSGELVLTAGHCVYSVSDQSWVSNFVYIPAYANGNDPYGIWNGVSMSTFAGFTSSGDDTMDTGYVAVSGPSNLVATVGGMGFGSGYTSFSDPLFTMGYPSASPENQAWCDATATITNGLVFLPCSQGPGASGSGILDQYDTTSGLGVDVSDLTLIWSYSDGSTANSGPVFGDAQWNEYLSMGSVVV
jgi:V8-like Glu-specific endopeptidase